MNINWQDFPPVLRQKIAESDPEAAEDLRQWEESLKIKRPITMEQYHQRLEEVKKELLASIGKKRKRSKRKNSMRQMHKR